MELLHTHCIFTALGRPCRNEEAVGAAREGHGVLQRRRRAGRLARDGDRAVPLQPRSLRAFTTQWGRRGGQGLFPANYQPTYPFSPHCQCNFKKMLQNENLFAKIDAATAGNRPKFTEVLAINSYGYAGTTGVGLKGHSRSAAAAKATASRASIARSALSAATEDIFRPHTSKHQISNDDQRRWG